MNSRLVLREALSRPGDPNRRSLGHETKPRKVLASESIHIRHPYLPPKGMVTSPSKQFFNVGSSVGTALLGRRQLGPNRDPMLVRVSGKHVAGELLESLDDELRLGALGEQLVLQGSGYDTRNRDSSQGDRQGKPQAVTAEAMETEEASAGVRVVHLGSCEIRQTLAAGLNPTRYGPDFGLGATVTSTEGLITEYQTNKVLFAQGSGQIRESTQSDFYRTVPGRPQRNPGEKIKPTKRFYNGVGKVVMKEPPKSTRQAVFLQSRAGN